MDSRHLLLDNYLKIVHPRIQYTIVGIVVGLFVASHDTNGAYRTVMLFLLALVSLVGLFLDWWLIRAIRKEANERRRRWLLE